MIKLLWAYEIPGTILGASFNSFDLTKQIMKQSSESLGNLPKIKQWRS